MREVDAVLEHVLRMHLQACAEQALLRVVVGRGAGVAEAREDIGDIEVRLPAVDVMPDVHRLIAFGHRVGPHATSAVGSALVRDADIAAVVVPLPAVERALDDLALDVAAVAEMGAEVFAIGVHHGQPPRLRAPRDHVAVEVLHPVHVADVDLVGPRDLEPTGRFHRQWRLGHGQIIEHSM